jgi:hypothetical protein
VLELVADASLEDAESVLVTLLPVVVAVVLVGVVLMLTVLLMTGAVSEELGIADEDCLLKVMIETDVDDWDTELSTLVTATCVVVAVDTFPVLSDNGVVAVKLSGILIVTPYIHIISTLAYS